MDLVNKFLKLQHSLVEAAYQEGYLEQDINAKVKNILRKCSELLQTSRISLWCFNDDDSSISCQHLYIQAENKFYSGMVIDESSCPNYFKALKSNRVINADDARTDKRTCEFTDGYLTPLNIYSMLDAPVFSSGKLSGVICIEQTDKKRQWDMAELSYAVSVADSISLIFAQEHWFSEKQKMRYMERIDPLTNLENRLFFQKRINQATKNSIENNNCAVVLLGLNNFTSINDRFGYVFANKVLCEIARRIEHLPTKLSYDLSRVGGDLFALWITPYNDTNALNSFIDILKLQFELEIKAPVNEMIQVSAAIGVFTSKLKNILDDDPIRKAELAMLTAKSDATDSVCYYQAEWQKNIQETLQLESEFIFALNNQQIIPHYQPILSKNYQQAGFSLEALVRWQHPTKGLLSPYIILPIAKKLGLMKELGDVILEQACKDAAIFRNNGLSLNKISVNISSEQLFSSSLISQTQTLIKKYKIDYSAIEFEIVEELIAGDSQVLEQQLDSIRKLGIELSIDDFGTGYSSLSRLKHLNVSKLKIDKSFVDGLPNNDSDICIAKSIIGLAKGMNLKIVAEGVETEEQAKWLLENGCDYLQGYLLSKPIAASGIEAFIKQPSRFPNTSEANYSLNFQGNILQVSVSGVWDWHISQQLFDDMISLVTQQTKQSWAILIDATALKVGTLDFQQTVLSNIERLYEIRLSASVYIISDNNLVNYQLELLKLPDSDHLIDFFTDKESAVNWLANHNFRLK